MQMVTIEKEEQDKDDASIGSTSQGSQLYTIGWSSFHTNFMHNHKHDLEMKDSIMLDNGSTIDLFRNHDFVQNISVSSNPMELHTNTGAKVIQNKAIVPGYGKVWMDERAIANISSLKI